MKKQHYGRIVNVSSRAGRTYPGKRERTPVWGLKAGLLSLTRYMAAELGPHGICVNRRRSWSGHEQRVRARFEALPVEEACRAVASIPLRRIAEPRGDSRSHRFSRIGTMQASSTGPAWIEWRAVHGLTCQSH